MAIALSASTPLPKTSDTRAATRSIREERVALGEPTDRTEISIDEKIRREYERWMVVGEREPDLPNDRTLTGSES